MRFSWWLLLVTQIAFPKKQRLFSVLAKKTQQLFLTMAVPIECIIKCDVENEKSCLCAWKIKQRKPNEMKTWICRQVIIFFVPMHPLYQCFPVIFSIQNPDKSLLSWKKLSSRWKPRVFWWVQGTGGAQMLINLLNQLIRSTFKLTSTHFFK